MRCNTKTTISFFLIPLLVAACSGDENTITSSSPIVSSGVDVVLDELADQYKRVVCKGAVDCHHAETEAECIAATDVEFDDIDLKAYIANGTIKFHPENVAECMASFWDLPTCSLVEARPQYPKPAVPLSAAGLARFRSACKPVFEGTVADGRACFNDHQCMSGTCAKSGATCKDGCCQGECAALMPPPVLSKIGEPCEDGGCEAGAYCESFVLWTCAAKVGEWGFCPVPDACIAPTVCNYNFYTGSRTCRKPAAHGESCDKWTDHPCDRLDDYCDETTWTCTRKPLPGDACGNDVACVDYAVCAWTADGTAKKCVKPLGETPTCASHSDCNGDSICDKGKCIVKPPVCQ